MDGNQRANPPRLGPAALAWFGNAAKMRIIERITSDGAPKTVFDFGAGKGAGWAETVRLHPQITLIAYEPDADSARALRLAVPTAQILDGEATAISVCADVIVSFSVFEHVADRVDDLRHAKRSLKPGGTFFLNYDDGHFRHPGSRLDAMRNLAAPFLRHVGLTRYYQSTVRKADADRMIAEAGFAVRDDRYENLEGIKRLSRTIGAAARLPFGSMWIELENRLNSEFKQPDAGEFQGDCTNLWREMASRTLELTRT